jgi:hypothetical protein
MEELPIKKSYEIEENIDVVTKTQFMNTFTKDLKSRVDMRKPVAISIGLFFLFQNIVVFALLGIGFFLKTDYDLRAVIAIVIPATVGTTAFALKEVVKLLFKDIQYQDYYDKIINHQLQESVESSSSN